MRQIESKAGFLELMLFEGRLKLAKEAGARLTPLQVSFLKDALYQGYLRTMGRVPKAMSPRERNLKKTLVDGLRSSMADLESYLRITNAPYQTQAWLTPKDLRRAISKEQLAGLVGGLCMLFGPEYADRVLAELSGTYKAGGARVQVVRDVP